MRNRSNHATRRLPHLIVLPALLLLAACGPSEVVPMAKAQGWRPALHEHQFHHAILEIAYDEATAARAWNENVPSDLDRRARLPDPGIYREPPSVDFVSHAMVVFSSGESGSCPGWLEDLDTDEIGNVRIELGAKTGFGNDVCTADYNAYRMVLAVARDRLPAAERLPTEVSAGVPDGIVVSYPFEAF